MTGPTFNTLPDGRIESTVTYLEMRDRPTSPTPAAPVKKLSLLHAEEPTVAFYRFLYNSVGGPWLWYERRAMGDEALAAIIGHENVDIYVLYVAGVPAGYAELDRRNMPDIELAYFGLMPEFIGRGLGTYLLHWAIDQAWTHEPERVWVHTCTEDHARALETYQRAGFQPYKRETVVMDDPREQGLFD